MTTIARPLSSKEAATMIGIAPTTLRIWRCTGIGPKFTKLGDAKQASVVYFEDDIQTWLAERKFTSTSAYSPHGRASSKLNNRSSPGASP
jgi:hypothetical protein